MKKATSFAGRKTLGFWLFEILFYFILYCTNFILAISKLEFSSKNKNEK